jgi:hypothetical protein
LDIIASRSHEVIKVYVSGPDGLDLLLIGRLIAGWRNGDEAEVGFSARIVMQRTTKGLRMKLCEAWPVSHLMFSLSGYKELGDFAKDQTPIRSLLGQSWGLDID